jgi:hypothetical protein
LKISAIILLILQLLGHNHVPSKAVGCKFYSRAHEIAIIVEVEAIRQRVDPVIIVKVMRAESAFDQNAIGDAGEVGLMQLKADSHPVISICGRLTTPQLLNIRTNIKCGVALLAMAKRHCKKKFPSTYCGGSPYNWLGIYNGADCGPSRYANKVMAYGIKD